MTVTSADVNNALSGTGVISDYALLGETLLHQDPTAALIAATGAAADTIAAVSDPIGTLLSAGAGWLMDHLDPLKSWLNDLTGDAAAVEAMAGRYEDVGGKLGDIRADVSSWVSGDLSGETAELLDAYRDFARETLLEALEAAGGAQEAMASAVEKAAAVVEVVHGLVRDALADLVGHILTWLGEEVFSLGLATGWVVEQVSTQVGKWVAKLSGAVHGLVSVLHELSTAVKELGRAGATLSRALDRAAGQMGRLEHALDRTAQNLHDAKAPWHPKDGTGKHRSEEEPSSTPSTHDPRHAMSATEQGRKFVVHVGDKTVDIMKEHLPTWVVAEGAYAVAKYVDSHRDQYGLG
ncbi:hypothetical protein P5P86_05365 [Nocardioides sp. BP30]|uniref:hypothetical protein n=1 Tax=Nocardioides sp. BP30 TaxID=3036374 RepID=UPI002468786E|nr:hypothetical protein [Nocardioides sp. BP30]WGL53254.1 hypothetical protein P5P86_05365 [Nocardioides sp. BP30]